MPRAVLAVLLLPSFTGCANPAGPTVPTGQEFRIRAGESVAIGGTDLGVRFTGVVSDSRCPANAICVTLGDATSAFRVTKGGRETTNLFLHTEPSAGRQGSVEGWTLTLTGLEPYPYAGQTIDPRDYEATLRVDPSPGSFARPSDLPSE